MITVYYALLFAVLALLTTGAPQAKLKRSIISTSTDELSATGSDAAQVNSNSSSASNNGNIQGGVSSEGYGVGTGLSQANLTSIVVADHENGTVQSASGTGLVNAQGTSSSATGVFGSSLNNTSTNSESAQEGSANGSGAASVSADTQNSVTNNDPSSNPTNGRFLLGNGDAKATLNALAYIAQYQRVNNAGATSLLTGRSSGDGADQSTAQVLAQLIKNNADILSASGIGNAIGTDTSANTYDYIFDVESNGKQVNQTVIGSSQSGASGGDDSEILASAMATNGTNSVIINGDAQGHTKNGNTNATGSALAITDMSGASGVAADTGVATGTEVDTTATNSIGANDTNGQTVVVATGTFEGRGTQDTGKGNTTVNSAYTTAGGGVSSSLSSGNANSLNGTANATFGNGAYVQSPITGTNNAENAGAVTATGDEANVSADSQAAATANSTGTLVQIDANAKGANSSSLDSEGQSLTNQNGVQSTSNGGTSMNASGDATSLISNLLLGISDKAAMGTTSTSGSSTGTGKVSMNSSSYLKTVSNKRRKKREASNEKLPQFATITVVCNTDGSRTCEYTLSTYNTESGQWVPSSVSNLFSLIQWLMRNQAGTTGSSDESPGPTDGNNNAYSYAYTSVTSNGVTRSSFAQSP